MFHSPARRPLPRCWRDEQADGGGEHAAEDEPLTNSEAKACSDLVERFGALRPDERWMTAPRGAVAERADASIRQDSVTQAAWRRFQPLRRSSPRGRPRASYWGSPPIAAFPPDASGSMAADTAGPTGTCSRTFALRARDLDRRAIRRERTTEVPREGQHRGVECGEHGRSRDRLTNSEAEVCPDLVERFGAFRPDERWMTAQRWSGRARGRLNIRQDSVIQAAWRRFQPLRRSSPRGRPRASLFCHRTMNFECAPGALEVLAGTARPESPANHCVPARCQRLDGR